MLPKVILPSKMQIIYGVIQCVNYQEILAQHYHLYHSQFLILDILAEKGIIIKVFAKGVQEPHIPSLYIYKIPL